MRLSDLESRKNHFQQSINSLETEAGLDALKALTQIRASGYFPLSYLLFKLLR